MNFKEQIIFKTFIYLNRYVPKYILPSIMVLLPGAFLLSLFELIGLATVFPVISLMLNPDSIRTNSVISYWYNYFAFQSQVSFILFLFFLIAVTFILKNILVYYVLKKQTLASFSIAKKFSSWQFTNYLNKPYSFHTNQNAAKLLTNISVIPFDFVAGILLPFTMILNELIIMAIVLVIIIYSDFYLFLALLITVSPLFYFYFKLHKAKLNKISLLRDQGTKEMNKVAMLSIQGYREITIYEKKDFFKPLFFNAAGKYTDGNSSLFLLNNFVSKIVETIAVISIVGVLVMGYFLSKDLSSLSSFLIMFSLGAYKLIPSLNRIMVAINNVKASFYVFDYFKSTTTDLQNGQFAEKEIIPINDLNFTKSISIRNVKFKYLTEEGTILNGVNLEIVKGSTVGIIGASGSGKSTLLNILLRLYKEDDGGVFLDDVRIDDNNVSSWYKKISYVPQDVVLIDGTIKENIAFGVPESELDEDLLKNVLIKSQLSVFVSSLKNGLETEVGDKGVKISGGQRQRLAIARALYHKGEILIFDEATSALDSETEQMLTESIRELTHQNMTIIIVAHRLQTLRYCDKIYKLEKGVLLKDALSYESLVKHYE